jgi:hypothetical protein
LDLFIQLKGAGNFDAKDVEIGAGSGVTVGQSLEVLKDDLDKAKTILTEIEKAKAEISKLRQIPADILKDAKGGFREELINLLATSNDTGKGVINDFEKIQITIENAINKVNILNESLQKLTVQPFNVNVIQNQIQGDEGGLVDDAFNFARGGIVPGGPSGTDTVPAWLTPGEIIINAEASKMFKAQLLAMNNLVRPRYYAGGGMVSNTNIGDIHVKVDSGDTVTQTARSIASELRRELRRGNIK